ncbi:MAG: FoF1 ATP synthase subunit a [Chloroflexota bacterium]|nr:FoF1 ATP synthase subunit a [Chloroflexota bacterium]
MSSRTRILLLLAIVIVIDVVAFLVAPPYNPKPEPGVDQSVCAFPVCFINGNLELPAPHALWRLGGEVHDAPTALITFDVSISSTILTMWIVTALVIVLLFALTRGRAMLPGKAQNAMEHVFELIEGFGMSLGGAAAKPFIPLFAGFFLYILFSNWSGLIPPVGKIPLLRAPTSDVNITIGLALVAFAFIEYQGFKALGIRGYLSKFFPIGEFRKGVGAGIIAMFVGLIELLLEFVKPVTLSMRLFGNIYGGEVALGVLTALTLAIIPMALIALELMLNLVQALIFSTLTLMFTLAAMEGHGDEHHEEHVQATEPTTAPAAVGAH